MKIVHQIVLEGPPEEVYPASKDLKTHIGQLKTEFEKNGLSVLHEFSADGSGVAGGSRAMKVASFAGKQVKAGLDFLFKEEKPEDGQHP